METILFIDNTAHHLYGQLHNITAARDNGYKVFLMIPDDGVYFRKLQVLGFTCYGDVSSWKGQNPLAELCLLLKLKKLYNRIAPDIICSFTIKPNLYTAIVNRRSKIKQIANITGLGYGFMNSKFKATLFAKLYRFAVSKIDHIFFQNKDDYNHLKNMDVFTQENNIDILPGSGVNLEEFNYVGAAQTISNKFLYSGRLIADKGIYELIAAFEKLKKIVPDTRLVFIGNFFPANPSAISSEQVNEWINNGTIDYLGMVDNVSEVIAESDCMILPSYREGMPRSLLEASSMGKPIITVDSVGCKDVVEDGVTGYLAKVKDVETLFDAMYKFTCLNLNERRKMGEMARKKMEREFDQSIVINKYLSVIHHLASNGTQI